MIMISYSIGLILIGCMFGGLCGGFIIYRKYAKKPVGILRVDSSDPDGPYLFLELKTDPSVITKEEQILLKVDTKSYISQK